MVLDYLVVTAPSEDSTRPYEMELRRLGVLPESATLLCVSDPPSSRLGSGGGTLNALSFIREPDLASKRVVVIHSGGESRRAPLHSVCGKCFATFNSGSPDMSCPIALLLRELLSICNGITGGFLLVASCDVLLDIFREPTTIPQDAISVFVVPEEMETARNHGVVVIADTLDQDSASIVVKEYLQKPSIDTMLSLNAQVDIPTNGHRSALIDTGVVVVTGKAFEKVLGLMKLYPLDTCCFGSTAQGRQNTEKALKFELYSDMLLSLSFADGECDWTSYLKRLGLNHIDVNSFEGKALFQIWSSFKDVSLYAVIIKSGKFAHLGTSAELLDLVTYTALQNNLKLAFFFDKLRLERIIGSRVFGESLNRIEGVVVNSLIGSAVCTKISSMVEHSILTGDTSLGSNSIVSYLHGDLGHDLKVADNTMLQLIRLKSKYPLILHPHCLVILGLYDDTKSDYSKSKSTFLGRPWDTFFDSTTLTPADIWSVDCLDKCLWNAKLFPVVSLDETTSTTDETKGLALWILGQRTISTVDRWKSSLRLSLADLIYAGDVDGMLSTRSFNCAAIEYAILQSLSEPELLIVSKCLLDFLIICERIQIAHAAACPHNILFALLLRSICFLDQNLLTKAVKLFSVGDMEVDAFSDIYSVSSSLFANYRGLTCGLTMGTWKAKCSSRDIQLIVQHLCKIALSGEIIRDESIPRYLFILAWLLHNQSHPGIFCGLKECVSMISPAPDITPDALEAAAQNTIRLHIQSTLKVREFDNSSRAFKLSEGVFHKMVVAIAPVRIDIAGGWSDTPPICYEASGAVFNVAVAVNGSRPICCVARFTRQPVIVLRTYGRTSNGVALNEEIICRENSDLDNLTKCDGPNQPCVLIKAALITLGFLNICTDEGYDMVKVLSHIGSGFEISSFSGLPAGSGMGGSSILAAAVVSAINRLWGNLDFETSALVDKVLAVEQVMTSGGGWQDQIGGILGGFKLGRTDSGLPLTIQIDQLPSSALLNSVFSDRVCLLYTGTQVCYCTYWGKSVNVAYSDSPREQ